MSALCQKQTSAVSFNELIGAGGKRWRHINMKRLRSCQIYHKLGRLHDWQVGRFGPLEDLASIHAGLTIGITQTRSVAHQSSSRSEIAPLKNRRQPVAASQNDKLLPSAVEKGRGANQQRTSVLCGYRRERRFKFTLYIGANNDQLKSEATCGLLYVVQLRVNGPVVGIHQDSDNVHFRNHFMQQPEALRFESCSELVNPS